MAAPPKPRLRRLLWLVAALLLIALTGTLLRWWQPIHTFISNREQIRAWVESLGPWGPAVIVLLETAQTLLAPIPGQAIEMVSGYLYGPWPGSLLAMSGIALGSSIAFGLSRRFGRPLAVRLAGRRSMAQLDDLARRGGAPFFFLLWLLPFVPDDLACIAAGLTPMPFRRFILLMLLGRWPGVFVSALVGANVARIEPLWWAALLALIAAVALILWRWGAQIQAAALNRIEEFSRRF